MPRESRRVIPLFLIASLSSSAAPTFYHDVLPLFQQHCQICHRAGEAAPMPLFDYSAVRPWAKAIKDAVLSRKMPPWFADPQFGKFQNDPTLSDSTIRTIVAWVDAGAPEGDPKTAPKPVEWVEGWKIGRPEIVFEMPSPADVPANGVLPYHYEIVPTHFQHDTWVRLAEVRAGDREHTHHIVVSIREPGSPWLRDELVGVPFTLKPGDAIEGQGEFLSGYGPGAVPETLAPGQAKLIKAGSDLVFQLHYTTDGKPGRDQSRVGLILAHDPPRQRVFMLAAANVFFTIPPGEPDDIVESHFRLSQDATLISLLPHMHLRGKSFEFRLRLPDGGKQTLLRVPHYDYDWQLSYYLNPPLHLPKGTIIDCIAHYDNSANNPRNPDPTKTVRFGPQSWDEMMIGYFEVAVDLKSAPR